VIEENHTTTIGNDHEDNDIILEDNNIISAIQSTPAPAISNLTPIHNHFNNIQTDIEDILNLSFNPEDGTLQANIKWKDGQESIIPAATLKVDDPVHLASFIERHPGERSRSGYWNNWSKTTLKDIRTITRCLKQKYIIEDSSKNEYYHCRCTVQKRKTNSNQLHSYLGVEIPRTVQEALAMDVKNQDNKWKEAMEKDISSMREHKTFEFLHPDASPPEGYQCAPLRMIFDVKSDLRRKARLVVGGHKVDVSNQNSYSSVVKLDSTRLLNVIAKAQGLKVLAGDIGNAYLNAETTEKVYCICGPEFGPELEGRIAIIKKGLYGLKSSGTRWHAHFANTLYLMGFNPSRYDPDV